MKELQIQSFLRGKNFPRVTCIGREKDRKRLSFAGERAAVKSSPVGDEKTNGSGPVRNRVRNATFPSFSRSMTRETRQPFDRCLFGRHCNVYILREQSESRSGRLTSFKCQLRYLEKKIFFFCVTVRFSRSQMTRNESALINANNRNVFLRQ